jgi:hypothetical protein
VPKTNDASLFRDPNFIDLTTRHGGPGDQGFYYRNQANEIMRDANEDITKMYHLSKDLNHDGKVFYSSCLNAKGGSQVCINDKAAGLPSNKIQMKAYRANTESLQVDGIYKSEKF